MSDRRKRKLRPIYSGHQSRKIWTRVGATGSLPLYRAGCDLQEAESRFLKMLSKCEAESKETR